MLSARLRSGPYEPRDPHAYVIRHDLRSRLPGLAAHACAVLAGLAVAARVSRWLGAAVLVVWAYKAYTGRGRARVGEIALAVDEPGVYAGESRGEGPTGLVGWMLVESVVLREVWDFRAAGGRLGRARAAVGVRRYPDYGGADDEYQLVYRYVAGWQVDRDALTAAVRRYAEDTPVVDELPPGHVRLLRWRLRGSAPGPAA
jgi:hypothetical protein